jgi:DNA-binding response OmpR family regulator
MTRLRKKIEAPGEKRLIETVRGVGYRLRQS